MRFSNDDLKRALVALQTIDREGDPDAIELILREARDSAPAKDPWQNAPIGAKAEAMRLARRLAGLLGAPEGDCIEAAAHIFARDYQRAVFDAILTYAAELGRKPMPLAPAKSTIKIELRKAM